MTELSFILVNWNCLDFTEQCIASIESLVSGIDYEVIVVDNASSDAPCASLTKKFPWVKLILSGENIGFGRANNFGAKESSGEYLFLLNPDTVLRPGAVEKMLETLKSLPESGAVGCRLLNPDGTLQLASVQAFPTIANQLLALEGLQRRYPDWSLWGKRCLYRPSAEAVDAVDVVSGAALMVKRSAFEQVEGFHRAYFMYAEEVELCYSLGRAGWKVFHRSDAEIVHFGGQATKKREDGFVDMAMRDSVYRFLSQTRGAIYARAYRLSMAASASLRLMALMICSPGAVLLGFPVKKENLGRSFRKWLRIGRWGLLKGDEAYNFRASQ